MTQLQLGELLRVDERSVRRWEAEGDQHMCVRASTELLLEVCLDDSELAARLEAAGLRNPFALMPSFG